ncbi:MAG: hypothetical protein ACOCVC_01420 [Spirochaeta sp.]
MPISQEHTLLNILNSLPPHELGSRLLAAPDRLIAMAAWGCTRESGERLLSLVPGVKQQRVREEYAFIEARRHRPSDMSTALEQLAAHLQGRRIGPGGSWLRPIRRKKD